MAIGTMASVPSEAAEGSNDAMIEGRILEVRESFPPQLVLKTDKKKLEVAVNEDTVIEKGGRKRGYEVLRRGELVRIRGTLTEMQTLTAERILLLEEVVGRLREFTLKTGKLMVDAERRSYSVTLVKETSVTDVKGNPIDRKSLRKALTVRVRYYSRSGRDSKEVFFEASSIKVLKAP